MPILITPKKLKDIMADFVFDYDNILQYDDETSALFRNVDNLEQGDKIIFTIYAHTGSLRKTATILGVSYTTTRKTINRIKEKILNGTNS